MLNSMHALISRSAAQLRRLPQRVPMPLATHREPPSWKGLGQTHEDLLQQCGKIIASSLARLPGLRLWQLGHHGVHDGSDQGRVIAIDQKHRLCAGAGNLLDGKRRARRGDVLEQQPVVVDAPRTGRLRSRACIRPSSCDRSPRGLPKKVQHVFEVFVG